MAPVVVPEVVEGALEDFRRILEGTHFEVATQIDRAVPPVAGDAVALRQVVTNLVDNAAKYAAAGRWVGVRVAGGQTSAGDEVTISVSDRGPGVEKRNRPHLFEPFWRGPERAGSEAPGSGIGLTLVRSIAEGHDGSITVSSRPGRGATFTVHLPAAAPARSQGNGR